jgi:hypothetical protein
VVAMSDFNVLSSGSVAVNQYNDFELKKRTASQISDVKNEAVINKVREFNLDASGSIESHEEALSAVARAKELILEDPESAVNAQGANIPTEVLDMLGALD